MLVRWQLLLTAATAAVVVFRASVASASSSTSVSSSASPSASASASASGSASGSGSVPDSAGCRPSEYLCDTGQCVAQDKFCDGEDDCGDKSDEPRYCSPCNRTLFGDVGRTYVVEVRRPREDRLPFLCNLNFTAAGSDLGDLVQLTFDTFTVGRFLSFTSEGCPDGYMTIRETGRPPTGGQWCGSAWGYTVYYSETPSINLTLFLSRLSEQGVGYNFDFKLSYKFLRKSEAHLRYGNSSMATWRGDLVNGTYCDRVLTRCDTRACRLQSPNYPGVYPRNVTCYYRVEQTRAPPGHRALLAVSQRNSHKIHIKDQIVKYDRSQRILRVWDQCNVVQDYLTVYDGGSTSDRVLVRLCGGDAVPDIVSSHNTMLLEFHTSPYDNPFHPVPLSFLPGFELEVQVLFVDEKSRSFVKENNNCDFYISGYETASGVLENPRHSLPPNTTCRYHFQGKASEIVWISFVKYYAASSDPAPSLDTAAECNTRLQIWDGAYSSNKQSSAKNVTLMGEFCKDDIPRLCDHSLLRNSSRHTRPCTLAESYVSTGRDLTLEHILRQGSALYPISFVLRYEFVHANGEGGVPVHESMSCNEVFKSSMVKAGKFNSPKSVFFYGRGGAQNLSCTYRLEAQSDQRVQLTISSASFGDRHCNSFIDPLIGRWACDYRSEKTGLSELSISEYPWSGVNLVRDCVCSNISDKISVRTLTSSVVEVRFSVTRMNITQDYRNFFFEAKFQFVDHSELANEKTCTTRLEERRLRGTSGEISLRNPLPHINPLNSGPGNLNPQDEVVPITNNNNNNNNNNDESTSTQCINEPWLIEPEDSQMNFLYLRTTGYSIGAESVSECSTLNRIVVYTAANTKQKSVICPEGGSEGSKTVDFFSDGWNNSLTNKSVQILQNSRSFVVEFLQREPGFYAVTWMAISKRAPIPIASSSSFAVSPSQDCLYRCPEIQACINVALWCDGVRHCPSGFDEEEGNCSYRFGVTLLYVAVGAGALGIFAILLLATGCLKYCLYRHKARKKKKNVAINVNNLHVNHTTTHTTHTHTLHQNNGLTGSRLSNRYLTTPQEMFLNDNYGKDSIC